MTRLLAILFDTVGGKAIAAVAGLAALVVAFAWEQRTIGAQRATHKIDQATTNAAALGRRAADKSRAGGLRGVVDPTTRYD